MYGGCDGEVFWVELCLGMFIGGYVDNGLVILFDVEVGLVVVIGYCVVDFFIFFFDFFRSVLYSNFY